MRRNSSQTVLTGRDAAPRPGASVGCFHCPVLAGHSGSSGMMWGMGLGHILVAVLSAAALAKYLFFLERT